MLTTLNHSDAASGNPPREPPTTGAGISRPLGTECRHASRFGRYQAVDPAAAGTEDSCVAAFPASDDEVIPICAAPAVVKALGSALRYQKLLDDGRYAAERIERGDLGTLLRLTLLAPAVVEELMEASPGSTPDLPELLQPFPEIWDHQQKLLLPQ